MPDKSRDIPHEPDQGLGHWYWRKLGREKGGHVQPSQVKTTPPDVGAKHPRKPPREIGQKQCPTCGGKGFVEKKFLGTNYYHKECTDCSGTGVVPA